MATSDIAVFDFDCTLTRTDTLVPWLRELAGIRRVPRGLANGIGRFLQAGTDRRTAFKAALLGRLARGRSVADGQAAARRLSARVRWRQEQLDRFAWHKDQGHMTVIATGSPRLAVAELVADHCQPDLLIGTELEVDDAGLLTGRILGGNCVREEKARRIEGLMQRLGPFGESFGYGNLPHDRAMLGLMQHRVVV